MKKMVIDSDFGIEFVSSDEYSFEEIKYNSKEEVLKEFNMIMMKCYYNEVEYMDEINECLKNLDNVDGKWFIGYGDEGEVMVGVEV